MTVQWNFFSSKILLQDPSIAIYTREENRHNVQSILYSITKHKSYKKGFSFIPTLVKVKVKVKLQVQVKCQIKTKLK